MPNEIQPKQIAWNVYLGNRVIDIVFCDPDCTATYVKTSLVDHDGYDQRITVRKRRNGTHN